MTKEEFLKSKYVKIVLPILLLAMIIALFSSGYDFGQWLYQKLN